MLFRDPVSAGSHWLMGIFSLTFTLFLFASLVRIHAAASWSASSASALPFSTVSAVSFTRLTSTATP